MLFAETSRKPTQVRRGRCLRGATPLKYLRVATDVSTYALLHPTLALHPCLLCALSLCRFVCIPLLRRRPFALRAQTHFHTALALYCPYFHHSMKAPPRSLPWQRKFKKLNKAVVLLEKVLGLDPSHGWARDMHTDWKVSSEGCEGGLLTARELPTGCVVSICPFHFNIS